MLGGAGVDRGRRERHGAQLDKPRRISHMVTMTVTTAAATAVAANVSAAASPKPERTTSVPMSRGFKIENLADEGGAHQSKLFSADALVHAVSGSVGGNVAMLGVFLCLRCLGAGSIGGVRGEGRGVWVIYRLQAAYAYATVLLTYL